MKKKDDLKNILSTNSYGHIRLGLKYLLDKKGIKRYTLARRIDTRFEVIDKWCEGDMMKLDLDILARICYVLDCGIGDILIYESTDNNESKTPTALT